MESDLECVVCYGVPKGKIFQCPNCHLLCEECRAKLDTFTAGKTLWSQVKCPKCRVFMGHDWIRNKWAEENVKKNEHTLLSKDSFLKKTYTEEFPSLHISASYFKHFNFLFQKN